MTNQEIPRVFVSYAHDSIEHKNNVRQLADVLIGEYGIDVIADCYEEDNPTGGLLTDFMQIIRQTDRVICVLSPTYKLKANEGRGGVGYESSIITDDLYKNIGSNRIIPITINPAHALKDCCPDFLTSIRKAVLRMSYDSDSLFFEEIARVIHNTPKKPKPTLGTNKLLIEANYTQRIEDIDITKLSSEYKCIFETAKFYAEKNDHRSLRTLFSKIKDQVFKQIDILRTKHETTFQIKHTDELLPIMDDFVEVIVSLFLIAFAGHMSPNEKFHKQEGLLIDLLSIDGWWEKGGLTVIRQIPKLLAYVYHHIYGALNISTGTIEEISIIFKQKIPVKSPNLIYEYLYQVPSVTGFVESLGRNCFNSFSFLLTAHKRWPWLSLLFSTEQEFQRALVSYQMIINLLFYFQATKNNALTTELEIYPVIPPSFAIADHAILQFSYHLIIKHSEFFKSFIRQINLSEKEALANWTTYQKMMGNFNEFGLSLKLFIYDDHFIENILK